MHRWLTAAAALLAVTGGAAWPLSRPAVARAEAGIPIPAGERRAHAIFDDSTLPPRPGIAPGPPAGRLERPKRSIGPRTPVPPPGHAGAPKPRTASSPSPSPAPAGGSGGSSGTTPPDPEVLGFAQSGEVTSGAWAGDLHFDLLSTVAYFGINFNGDGSPATGDSGYQGWWSAQATNLINSAHSSGDRAVLTIKAFDTSTIASITGSESYRQNCIANVIQQVLNRGGDGVNVDFEGYSSSIAPNFTTFIAELQYALRTQIPERSYLTVDTYASSAQGGTMMDIGGLSPYVDAFDVMAYDFTSMSSANAGPTAPMYGYSYTDTGTVNAYLGLIPPSQLILGVPYYGYKWSVANNGPRAPTLSGASADTYSGAMSDFSCALSLSVNWDPTFLEPWATWYSPASGDPCGGNHGAWRELYYDNAASLGYKYDLVNGDHLRGIGIWALGYDSGYSDLWAEIQGKFTVTHFSQLFVQHLYPDVLGRPADTNGLIGWSRAIDGGESRYDVSLAFATSAEFRYNGVVAWYNILLHRPPDSSGLQWGTGYMGAGGTWEGFRASLAGSDEYYANRGGGTVDGFLSALWSDILHRSLDSSGRQWGEQQLAAGASRYSVALAVLSSDEALRLAVNGGYQQFLRRPADQAGLDSWVYFLEHGGRDEQLLAGLTGSTEYLNYVISH